MEKQTLNDHAEAFYLYQLRRMKDKEESKLFSLWWTETGRDQYISTCVRAFFIYSVLVIRSLCIL